MTDGTEQLVKQLVESKDVLPEIRRQFSESKIEISEYEPKNELPNGGQLSIEKPDISFIERTTRTSLFEQNVAAVEKINDAVEGVLESDLSEKKGLTDEEKATIKDVTGWSDEIIDNIENMKQYEILKNAGLKEVEINGRNCLIKENIDLDYKDADGISNRDRVVRGLTPLDNKTSKPLELHHLGQKKDSPLVELTEEEHRTGEYEDNKKNQSLWHDNSIETEVHGKGNAWNEERKEYWKARSKQLSGGDS